MAFDRRISLITLGVADVARATAFYERLGWTRSSASQDAVTFIALKGTVLALYGRQALAEDAGVAPGPGGFSGVTLAHNVGSEADVDEAFRFAVDCGAQAVRAPSRAFWGGYTAYFADPDGHLWEIAHNPGFPLDADGHVMLPD